MCLKLEENLIETGGCLSVLNVLPKDDSVLFYGTVEVVFLFLNSCTFAKLYYISLSFQRPSFYVT